MTRTFISLLVLAAGVMALPPAAAADRQAADGTGRATPVGAGDIAPDFTLEGHDGSTYTLSAERSKQPVVLVFYRGHW